MMLPTPRPVAVHTSGTGVLELAGSSAAAARLRELVRRAAGASGGVLIVAEPGSEPESVARDLHARSARAGGSYVVVDCGGADGDSLDRELFGLTPPFAATDLEPASPTSVLAAARGGTLFLRDVTELPAAVQGRLARVARDGEVRIDGEPVATAIRLVASAPPTIDGDVREHRFRGDLYRRLSAIRIDLPPLADRSQDLPELAAQILADICAARGVAPRAFTDAALALVAAFRWPGNVGELRSAIDRVVALSDHPAIHIEHLLPALQLERAAPRFVPAGTLREARVRFEREYISAVLHHHEWRMGEAARTLGIQRPNLYRKARQLGIPLVKTID